MSASTFRPVSRRLRGQATSDGAGVSLTRVIGTGQLPDLDPFLLLDEFGSDKPGDYLAGFPSHPHRGFETVTYMLDGRMRHRDNHGNEGLLTPGSVQWMTAGRGIVHSEMPEQEDGLMRGFQLWVNLPAKDKMVAPRYQEFSAERIPEVVPAAGVRVKVIAGAVGDIHGPVQQPATDPVYLDISLAAGARFEHAIAPGHNVFAYVYEGEVGIVEGTAGEGGLASGEAPAGNAKVAIGGSSAGKGELLLFGAGDAVGVEGRAAHSRLILVAGRPLGEPVARHGPFVMNTHAEIVQAVQDFQAGRF